jgi:hypothetical protein
VTSREEAVRLAQTEVIAKDWGVSRQVLAVNEVMTGSDGRPVIARVAEGSEPDTYCVYFPIHEEPYYFVVAMSPDKLGQLAVSGVYIEGDVRAYLAITSVSLSPAQITARVGLNPSETPAIGDAILPSPVMKYREHWWQIEPQRNMPASVEEKITAVLDAVEPAVAQIAALKPVCELRVTVVFEGWGGDPQFGGFGLDARTVRRLAALGADLVFDLYAFGPRMPSDEAP